MAPPPTSTISRIITLVLKIFMFVLLLVSLVVLVTDTAFFEESTYNFDGTTFFEESTYHFDDIYTYRYVLASIIFGLVYSLLQTGFSLYHIVTGNRLITGDGAFVFDFYGDKVISYVLATGSAAGFGATKDLKALADNVFDVKEFDNYFDKAYASASMLLFAFLCAAILSVFSSYALPKMVTQTS